MSTSIRQNPTFLIRNDHSLAVNLNCQPKPLHTFCKLKFMRLQDFNIINTDNVFYPNPAFIFLDPIPQNLGIV